MRLTSPEVKVLLLRGQRQSVGAQRITFMARTLPQEVISGDQNTAKLAIAVPKRLLKRAIDRNRAKRVLRESFRLHELRAAPLNSLITLTASPKSSQLTRRRLMASFRVAAIALLNKVAAANSLKVRV